MLLEAIYYGKTPISWAYKAQEIIWGAADFYYLGTAMTELKSDLIAYATSAAQALIKAEYKMQLIENLKLNFSDFNVSNIGSDTGIFDNVALPTKIRFENFNSEEILNNQGDAFLEKGDLSQIRLYDSLKSIAAPQLWFANPQYAFEQVDLIFNLFAPVTIREIQNLSADMEIKDTSDQTLKFSESKISDGESLLQEKEQVISKLTPVELAQVKENIFNETQVNENSRNSEFLKNTELLTNQEVLFFNISPEEKLQLINNLTNADIVDFKTLSLEKVVAESLMNHSPDAQVYLSPSQEAQTEERISNSVMVFKDFSTSKRWQNETQIEQDVFTIIKLSQEEKSKINIKLIDKENTFLLASEEKLFLTEQKIKHALFDNLDLTKIDLNKASKNFNFLTQTFFEQSFTVKEQAQNNLNEFNYLVLRMSASSFARSLENLSIENFVLFSKLSSNTLRINCQNENCSISFFNSLLTVAQKGSEKSSITSSTRGKMAESNHLSFSSSIFSKDKVAFESLSQKQMKIDNFLQNFSFNYLSLENVIQLQGFSIEAQLKDLVKLTKASPIFFNEFSEIEIFNQGKVSEQNSFSELIESKESKIKIEQKIQILKEEISKLSALLSSFKIKSIDCLTINRESLARVIEQVKGSKNKVISSLFDENILKNYGTVLKEYFLVTLAELVIKNLQLVLSLGPLQKSEETNSASKLLFKEEEINQYSVIVLDPLTFVQKGIVNENLEITEKISLLLSEVKLIDLLTSSLGVYILGGVARIGENLFSAEERISEQIQGLVTATQEQRMALSKEKSHILMLDLAEPKLADVSLNGTEANLNLNYQLTAMGSSPLHLEEETPIYIFTKINLSKIIPRELFLEKKVQLSETVNITSFFSKELFIHYSLDTLFENLSYLQCSLGANHILHGEKQIISQDDALLSMEGKFLRGAKLLSLDNFPVFILQVINQSLKVFQSVLLFSTLINFKATLTRQLNSAIKAEFYDKSFLTILRWLFPIFKNKNLYIRQVKDSAEIEGQIILY